MLHPTAFFYLIKEERSNMASKGTDICPIEHKKRRCAVVSETLINNIGRYISKPVLTSDLSKLIEMSSAFLYNEEESMRGVKKTLAVNISDTNTWLRLNVSKINSNVMNGILSKLRCK